MKKRWSSQKPRLVTAGAVTGVLAVFSICAVRGEGLQSGKLILALLLSVLAGAFVIVKPGLSKWAGAGAALFIPLAAVCCMEFYTHVPWDLKPGIFLLNSLGLLTLDLALSCFTGRWGLGYALGTAVPMLFGAANYFVVSFRSSPLVPWDFLSIGTAATVTDNYVFTITYRLVYVLAGFVFLMILGEKIRSRPFSGWKRRIAACLLSAGILWGYVSAVQTDAVKEVFGLDDILFTPNVLYRNNGLTVAFLANLQYLDVEKPAGYSAGRAEEIAAESAPAGSVEEEVPVSDLVPVEKPNILVIMNEAFSDLSVYGDFETSEDYMPYIRSLKENTVKGNLYVSVLGGNTANTEFEFLTGNSMAFLPAGSIPYQQFIKGEMPSLADHMKSLGYNTAALHPYYASGWNREQVYDYLGFDRKYFIEDFSNASYLRGWVDDKSAFEKLIELYEEKESQEPLFAFEVTMQNHGGYSKEYADLEPEIRLTGYPESLRGIQVEAVEKYLTLIRRTDQAFRELTEYFEKEEPTLILMFGDHQPSDYISNPILRLLGIDPATKEDSLELFAKGYQVPFVMWANYEIGEEEVEEISANYLSSFLMEKAGLPKSGYQNYLDGLREQYPVITANFYRDGADGELKELGKIESSRSTFDLNSYGILQYNDLCDPENRLEGFFGE